MDKINTTGVIDQTIYSDTGNVMYIVNVELNGNIVKAQSIQYMLWDIKMKNRWHLNKWQIQKLES